jgi:ABC-2 type transport system permease protein
MYIVQPNSGITTQDIQDFGKSLTAQITYIGTTAELNSALDQLRVGIVDLVIVVPTEAITAIKNNQQAVFTFYYHAIDPVEVSNIKYLGWLYVGVVNQQVLESFASQGQKDSVTMQTSLQEAHQNVTDMRQALLAGNTVLAHQKQQALAGNVSAISLAADASLGLLDSLQQTSGSPTGATTPPVQTTLSDLNTNTTQLGNTTDSNSVQLARLDKTDKNITDLETKLAEFQSIQPSIMVSPFVSETKSVANAQPTMPEYFALGVLALLLQHLAVTFSALSIVRERSVGTLELFRVSPLSAAEALFGKYISYMLFGGVIAAILSALLVFGLHVPMLGSWWYFALVIAAVLFTSMGIGFTISIISQSDSQAVQYSMIVLLASVFFSGFIMSLNLLWQPVRVISWMLPTTYGTQLLRDIALRGIAPDWTLLAVLLGIGVVLMFISWRLLRRLIKSSQ